MKETPHPGLTIDVVGEDLDQQGRGLARWNGWVITVPQLLPGEEAKVKVQQRQRKMWLARRVATISSSPDARRPPCILASDCGGCSLQHLSVDAQNSWKQQRLANTLSRIGQLDPDVNALVSPDRESLGYRNRALIPISRDGQKGGGIVDSPTGVHQDGVNTRWNGCVLVRGLVGQDKSYFMWFPWITKLDLEPLACCPSSCSSRARSSALAPTPAAACKDRTSPEMTQRPPPPTTHHPPHRQPPTTHCPT